MEINLEDKNLNCYRCASAATTYIPEKNRVLCDTHLSTFKEAYASIDFSSVSIDDLNVNAIESMLTKNSADVTVGEVETASEHRVPIKLIIDHLGELETGVEPATCKVCKKPMQLHSQYEITKQELPTVKKGALPASQFREVTHPNFLANFADSGRGVCLGCNGTGIGRIIDDPSNIRTIYRHLNDEGKQQGHYNQLMDFMSSLRDVDKSQAMEGNLPFVITRYNNFAPNPQFDPSQISTFPFSVAGYEQFDFGSGARPQQVLHTLFHAAGEHNDAYHPGHDHYEGSADPAQLQPQNMIKVLCPTCEGVGEHPHKGDPDVADELERVYQKSLEIPRDQQRRQASAEEEVFEIVSHAGPGIKPHDHKNKPAHYQKRDQGAGGVSAPSSAPRAPRSPGGPRAPRMKTPKAPGMGGGGGLFPRKKPFYLEKFIYDQSNMWHDISHTEYKNPSYMYRNPNPMYYSVPRSGWGDSKPWRN